MTTFTLNIGEWFLWAMLGLYVVNIITNLVLARQQKKLKRLGRERVELLEDLQERLNKLEENENSKS